MSVNGQNPRTNTYLLDGTLQNDFTNSPASSAAGTALGMETIREFRARLEQLQRRVRAQRRRPGQRASPSRAPTASPAAASGSIATSALDARNYFDVDAKPSSGGTRPAARVGGPLRRRSAVLLRRLRRACSRTSAAPSSRRCRTTTPAAGCCRRAPVAINPTTLPYLLEFPSANGPSLGGGLAQHRFGFDQRARRSTSCRAASTPCRPPARSSSSATRSTTPSRRCRPTTRSSRARSSRATSS